LWASLVGSLWALLLRLNGLTWRKQWIGMEELDDRLARGDRTLLCFWHGKYLPLLFLLRGRRGCVFTSLSFRGGVIASLCHRLGYDCVKIPEVERGRTSEVLREAMEKYRLCGIAIDGPLGPYHAVKRRPIRLASSFGFVVLPVSVASGRKFVLRSRWDRMEVPYPFARVCVVLGKAFGFSAPLRSREATAITREIRKALDEAEARAENNLIR
jgi:lysophospholipid acyltransferase (LPLAT)-like uncharacterized protein